MSLCGLGWCKVVPYAGGPACTCWAVSAPAHLVEGHSEAALSLGGSHFLEGTVVTLVTSQKCLQDIGQPWLQGGESHT